MVGGIVSGDQRPGPGQARACVSPGGGRAALDPDTAAEELPARGRAYTPLPGAVCRRFAAHRMLNSQNAVIRCANFV